MVLALVLSTVFLVIVYGVLEGKPWIGLINVFPILIAVSCLLGTMRLLDMPLNAVTGLLLSFAIGLGVDYAVHFMHRFVDEYTATRRRYRRLRRRCRVPAVRSPAVCSRHRSERVR